MIWISLFLFACRDASVVIDEKPPSEDTGATLEPGSEEEDAIDADEDGFVASDDCDDNDPYTYPGAAQQESQSDCMTDVDGDGFGDSNVVSPVIAGTDCNDDDAEISPGAAEIPVDTLDGNCDGMEECYPDLDNDGYGAMNDADGDGLSDTINSANIACDGETEATIANDCDDSDGQVHPDSVEIPNDGIDQDCTGADLVDADADGWGIESDCDDTDPSIHPEAIDIEDDGIDQDCSGSDRFDGDGDGFVNDEDCDDTQPTVYPGADELCDQLFNDCNHAQWSLESLLPDEVDDDGDGYIECSVEEPDCDDADASIFPGAEEVISDGIDQNCDGIDPEDGDGDGWGSDVDCDDTDASLNLDDVDGDGAATCAQDICFVLDMADTYGDGWNGGSLAHYEDDVLIAEYAAVGALSSVEFCVSGTKRLELVYTPDEWEEENSYVFQLSDGTILHEDGPNPAEGTVYRHVYHAVVDCDDTDATRNTVDVDQDRYTTCDDDCDDNNSLYNLDDFDGDGESSCDGDCDDEDPMLGLNDIDGDGWGRCDSSVCFELELIDLWEDGWSGSQVTLVVEGVEWGSYSASGAGQIETICMLNGWTYELSYTAGIWEQDNVYIWRDTTTDLFTDGPYPAEGLVYENESVSQTDCDDHNTSIYPGAIEIPDDGIDQDCDGVDWTDADGDGDYNDVDCDDGDAWYNLSDTDGDGLSSCDGDCDDSDAELNWNDTDADGFSSCAFDCDDTDPTRNLNDADEDGFHTCGYELCYTFEMEDTYGDGWNGGYLTLFNNGIEVSQLQGEGSSSNETVCVESGYEVEVTYVSGSWEQENTFFMFDENGAVVLSGGPNISVGTLYTTSISSNPDCDDTAPLVYPGALDIPNDGIDQDCDGSN